MALYETLVEAYDLIFPVHPGAAAFFGGPPPGRPSTAIDVGCATGAHAELLSELGWDTLGLDPSAGMIAEANRRAAAAAVRQPATEGRSEAGSLRFEAGGMLDLPGHAARSSVSLVACLGNTVPHLASGSELMAFFLAAAEVLAPGGRLVVQQLNYAKILAERPASLPLVVAGPWKFGRSYRYRDDGRLDFVTSLEGDGRDAAADVTTLSPFLPSDLAEAADAAGLGPLGRYGGWDRSAFDEAGSIVLLEEWLKSRS